MKNIDSRISKLGVSDYKAYVQNLDNQNYIVVEIGGIADLDQAKELIGKTLELEFKLQNPDKPTKSTIAARKKLSNEVFVEIQKDPENIQKMLEGRMSENIYHSVFTGNTLDQLPDMYKKNPKLLADAEIGKLYGPIEGNYTTIYQQSDNALTQGTGVALDGYTMFRLLDKQE
jgi:preprotein translocase subunit SecD